MKTHLLGGVGVALILAVPAVAQTTDAGAPAAAALNDTPDSAIIVTGTRQTGIRAIDSAAPIQVVGPQVIENSSSPDLGQILSSVLPSFNFQQWGGDASNLTLTATLRGLSPNDTLVLLNGKRLHGTSNLAISGEGPAQGGAAPDLSFIPPAAISRIEVLQDGAAAQYGSDAIAGVVNIILKNNDHGFNYSGLLGTTYQGGGTQTDQSVNAGFKLGQHGFLNLTGEYKYHNYATRGGADDRVYNPNGTIGAWANPLDIAGAATVPGAPVINREYSTAQYMAYNLAANAGYDLGNDTSLYFDGTLGHRSGRSLENYRTASHLSGTNINGTIVYPFLDGYTPLEGSEDLNYTATGGIKGLVSGWRWDLSLTYGRDRQAIYTTNSVNDAIYQAAQALSATVVPIQRNFYDGTFVNSEATANLDLSKDFNLGWAKPLSVAAGAEFRNNQYTIKAGEPASYSDGGIEAYQGFSLTDQSRHSRHNWAGYIDLATNPIQPLHLDLAGRYETYSDFGSVWTGKFNARYDISPAFALRGTISNGFRAPTLAEEYYSQTSLSPYSATAELPANSVAASSVGLPPLKPEKSTNFSAGFVAHPTHNLQLTVDAYQITIRNRIIESGSILGYSGTSVISQGVLDAIAARGVTLPNYIEYASISTFTNGANTRTRGIEATADYVSQLGAAGRIDWSLGFNYNQTIATRIATLPAVLANIPFGQTSILSPSAISALTTASPRVKVVANALWSIGQWSVNLRETLYGATSEIYSTSGSGINGVDARIGTTFITDLEVGYKLTRNLRLDAGASNLFNHQAPSLPNVPNTGSGAPVIPVQLYTYNAPIPFTPWGIEGGYYYARATLKF